MYLSNSATVGSTQATAFDLQGAGYSWPLPIKAVTGQLANAGDVHYYKLWAQRGEIVTNDAFAQQGAVAVSVEPDKRSGSGTTAAYDRLFRPIWTNGSCASQGEWTAGTICEEEGGACMVNGSIVDDLHGGIVRNGLDKVNSHTSFIAPWNGYYFVAVKARVAPASYVLDSASGVVWSGYPTEY